MKKIIPIIIITLTIAVLAYFAFKGTTQNSENVISMTSINSAENVVTRDEPRLYISRDKLGVLLGKDFVPITNQFVNLDNDSEEEYLIAFKRNKSDYVNIYIFDIIQNDVIRKQFSIETTITESDNLLIQPQNLFLQNDLHIIIEGKTANNKQIVYIISYENNQYNVVEIFTGDFSVLINYEEIENDKGKYDILSDVTVINNSFSTTNENIKRRDVYKWNYTTKSFYKAESTEIRSEASSINSLIYGSEEKYYHYISGFWYPSEYKNMIDNNKLSVKEFDYKTIQFVSFNENPREISIKFGDYIETYRILRISKVWGHKPGLRFRMVDSDNRDAFQYLKSMDIFLMSPQEIRVLGPHKYASNTYIRLPKPFLEYVYDREREVADREVDEIEKFLIGDFYDSFDKINLTFEGQNKLTITTDTEILNCYYKMNHNENLTMISLINANKGIFGNTNFIMTLDYKNAMISLVPIKLSVNGFTIDNIKSLNFIKTL